MFILKERKRNLVLVDKDEHQRNHYKVTHLTGLKATVSFRSDWSGLPCLVQLLTWLPVSDCSNFWNTERETSSKNCQPFLSKGTTKIVMVWIIRFCSNFTSMWSKYSSNNVWETIRLVMSALTIETWNVQSQNQFLQ